MGVKSGLLELALKRRGKPTPEQEARAKRTVKERILTEEMEVNPALAKQAAAGDISVDEAALKSANQNRQLGVGKEQESLDDFTYVNTVNHNAKGTLLTEYKQALPDKRKAEWTDAEIAFKKGNPKPLADLYKKLGVAAAVGASGAMASEDAEAMPSLILKKGLDFATAGRQIKNKINKEGGADGKAVERFIHEHTNYDNGFTEGARRWDNGRNGDTYTYGIKKMAYQLLQNTEDPTVRRAVMGWLTPRLQRAAVPVAGIGMSKAALANTHIKDSGHIQAPRSEGLFGITMGLRDLGRRIEGSPAELLNPENLAQYLETVNRETEDPNATTRMFAALDVMP